MYNIINLAQGSKPWLQFKQDKIGSSEISTIIGVNEYQTASRLLNVKRGDVTITHSDFQLGIFERGHQVEEKVRAEFYPDTVPVVVQSTINDRFIASIDCARIVDGAVREIIEIKSTAQASVIERCLIGDFGSYYPQVQWQMMLCGLTTSTLLVVDMNTMQSYEFKINIDLTYPAMLVNHAEAFLAKMDAPKTELTQPLREKLDQLFMLKSGSVIISKQMDEIDQKIKSLADEILKETNSEKLFADQVKIETVERQGSVDYSKIELLKTVNLDQYRKKPSRYIKVTLIDGKKEMTNE
jgi:putative phage-type endonuclease